MTQFAKETLPISLEEEMRRSYLDYAMSVIVGRALPDARDGLKPVHRRVLYAMHELNNDWNRPYKKSARIVGDVIGKYHPHGDSAVYDTIVRMAQDFSLRHMLVDGQGNFGSVDGDSAAAMRYTEIRLSKIAHEMLADIDKETVDFGPNYDGSEQEPLVLPTRLPNLLVNGSAGIAVGMATNIPPHNLNEVVDACLHLLRHPGASVEDLMEIIPAPDFPTAGIIYGIQGVKEGYRTGRGRVVMRAKCHFEDIDKGQRQAIIVDEIPYQVNKKTLLERIAELVHEKQVDGGGDAAAAIGDHFFVQRADIGELGAQRLQSGCREPHRHLHVVLERLDRDNRAHAERRMPDAHPGAQREAGRLVLILIGVRRLILTDSGAASRSLRETRCSAAAVRPRTVGTRPVRSGRPGPEV